MTSDEQFAGMLDEWQALTSMRAAAVDGWNDVYSALAAEENQLRAAGRWVHGPDDMFGVLGIGRAETRHSAIVAWLLDPSARHGLGTGFLERVLRRAFPEQAFEDLSGARPDREVTRGDCRADIVVWMKDATIVIESKVDAVESQRQCEILHERFVKNVGARFVFLTPKGRAPVTDTGESAGQFAAISFPDLKDALKESLKATRVTTPFSGRRVAEDYLVTLGREFR